MATLIFYCDLSSYGMIDIAGELSRYSDRKYDELNRKLVPGIDKSYGVRVPDLRKIAKLIAADDLEGFLNRGTEYFEEDMLKSILIKTVKMPPAERMGYLRAFVPTISNWAVCDTLCGVWSMNPHERNMVWDYCLELMESDSEYGMRFAVVMMMSNYIDDYHVMDILRLVAGHRHEGYYYKMAAAWCLSFCFVDYPEETEPFIFRMEPDVMGMTVRKICDSYRVDSDEKERLKGLRKEILTRKPKRTAERVATARRK